MRERSAGRYDAVLFDLDGTLLDTLDDLVVALNHALAESGFPQRSTDEIRDFLGNGFARLVDCALPQGEGTPGHEEVLRGFAGYYGAHYQVHTHPYEGIEAMLEDLQAAGMEMAIVSNKRDEVVRELTAYHFDGLIRREHAFGECEGLRRKPARDMVDAALGALGVQPTRALYVGDSDVDLMTARNAHLDCVLVSWGFKGRAFLETLGEPCIVDDVPALKTVCLG